VRAYLVRSDGVADELHILPGKSEDGSAHRVMNEGYHLLLSDGENRVLAGVCGRQSDIIKDENLRQGQQEALYG
jgi:hypothetical protein